MVLLYREPITPRSPQSNLHGHIAKRKTPTKWKDADVVPIPKAKKTTYTIPKSWRAIHLLWVVSKSLERIVLRRLQEGEGEEWRELGKSQ